MGVLQALCVAIVALYLVARLRHEPARGAVLLRLGVITLSSLVAEDSAIRLYHFYAYSPAWWCFVDRVPLLVALIWPVVVDSAWTIARRLAGGAPGAVPLATAAIVLADASLIEPVAVQSGLWHWTEPGLLAVPPVGLLGWSFFTLACVGFLAWIERGARSRALVVALPLVALAVTHALLLASWWGLLRWVNGTVPAWPVVAATWGLSVTLATRAWRAGLRRRVPLREMLVRVPPALLFFGLLARHGARVPVLVAYALAFAPPYLALCAWPRATAPHAP